MFFLAMLVALCIMSLTGGAAGAAIGAGVGGAGGFLDGKHKASEQKAYQQGQQSR
jgi:hypothetical protein